MLFAKKCAWLAPLFMAGQLAAQDKIESPSGKTKEAVEKLLRAPTGVKKALEEISDAVKAKLKQAAAENDSDRPNAEPPGSVEKKANPGEEFRAAPLGKRDPFRPFTLNTRSSTRRRENLSPLERFELGQLKLVGVIWDIKEPNALVEDSAGLGYIVRVGTPIGSNEGKVKLIKPNEIVIEELFIDLYGAKKKREVPMKLFGETAE